MMMTEGFGQGGQMEKTQDNDDLLKAELTGPRTLYNSDHNFCSNVDVGVSFPVIPSFPGLNVSILFSHHLTRTPPVQREGFVANVTQDKSEVFYFRMNNRYNNLLLALNYSFGKQ